MAHYQQHGKQATRVDEYGNPFRGGHGILGTGIGGGRDAAGGYGRQAGYGPIGTGVHDDGGYGGSGQPGFGATGTGTHDAGGVGGYGPTGIGPHVPGGYGAEPTGIGRITGNLGTGGHTGMLGGTHGAEHKTVGGIHRRSGSSSSSSSSEDDGMGGRRKKGMKEKIKKKLPGGHKDNYQHQQSAASGGYGPDSAYTTGTGGSRYADGTHEKKGIMDKIKEKLPGGHKDEYGQQHTTTTAIGGYGPGRTGTTGAYGTTDGTHEKKGIMDKIKEKLPGQH